MLEVQEVGKFHAERMEALQQYEGLQHLEDFILGKVTHYVVTERWQVPRIIDFDDTEAEYARNREKRLLTLFGNSEGNLAWQLNRYADGSGGSTQVIPCRSLEEAQEVLSEKLLARMENVVDRRLLEAALAHNIPLPEAYREAVGTKERKVKEDKVKELRRKLYAAEADLEESEKSQEAGS